jgi:hypothetical protein
MGVPEGLTRIAGAWRGTNVLRDPHMGVADDSSSTATVTPVLGERFLRIDYTWSYQSKPQEGSMLIACDSNAGGAVTIAWIDSWHMSEAMMISRGTVTSDGSIDARGSYAAPPGPDWGWRTAIQGDADRLRVTMHNVTPDGLEELAVDATYSRA